MTPTTINMFDGDFAQPKWALGKQEIFRKPITAPRPFDWDRKWPTVYTTHPWTVQRTLAADELGPALKVINRRYPGIGGDAMEYVKAWDEIRCLKPCTAWVKVEASYG